MACGGSVGFLAHFPSRLPFHAVCCHFPSNCLKEAQVPQFHFRKIPSPTSIKSPVPLPIPQFLFASRPGLCTPCTALPQLQKKFSSHGRRTIYSFLLLLLARFCLLFVFLETILVVVVADFFFFFFLLCCRIHLFRLVLLQRSYLSSSSSSSSSSCIVLFKNFFL